MSATERAYFRGDLPPAKHSREDADLPEDRCEECERVLSKCTCTQEAA